MDDAISPERDTERQAAKPAAATGTRTRDPERTKANILAAATSEFSSRGFAGARVDAIAARSRANKRMIYHYFGNKQGLWLAVLEAAYERVRTAELGLHLAELEPEQAMRTLVRYTFESFVGDRVFINLLNSENLHQARHLKHSSRIKSMHSPLIGMIQTILDRGVATGVFRAGVDPAQLWLTIAGISFFYFSNIYTLSVILDKDLKSKSGVDTRRDHVVDFVMNGLKPGG
ncbi:TetR/AcrR family transcriptional regulator [Mangrovibrevibacter kandeliae]|uniref:TetR/AcrR family transcriptional regulator n=1 Tax=Mangrovibrevibacter kandeliae TaxID=2968473 RepID=UPI002118AE44|nr:MULTISPECIES: TetR/AcrR family transcriptional regulator [unclassified Aurantimonas]MCQ8783490.1 TetR family transcriptional regulator [Aurantimonas sp. CSK15Z-1]MCW4115994.1 TetR family transcriptional regulator [Aurantimonas sp. MSK8Z-1]